MGFHGEMRTTEHEARTLTRTLAEHTRSVRFARLPPDAVLSFRRALVDYIACVCAGVNMPPSKAVRAYGASLGATGVATVIGAGLKLSPPDAAFANGTAAHALDFDDGHREASAHPGGVVFSAALAVAESRGSNWEEFVEAVVAGYDVMLRIAASMHPASAGRGWHNSSVAGVFGSSAAASRLLGLDGAAIADAFGLAASFAGGLREYLFDGSDVKRLHLGKAARDGIVCAGLAAAGVSGAKKALEGRNGVFRAFAGENFDAGRLTEGLGDRWEISSVYFKPYPCCRHFQAAIDAIVKIKSDHDISPDRVEKISVGLYGPAVPGHDHIDVTSLLDAQMSAPCAVVAALQNPSIGARHFEPDRFSTVETRRLLEGTRVYVDDECSAEYPKRRTAVVSLTMDDGQEVECRIRDPRGENENPLTNDELGMKFMDNVSPVWGEAKASALLSSVWDDSFAGLPVTNLTAVLAVEG